MPPTDCDSDVAGSMIAGSGSFAEADMANDVLRLAPGNVLLPRFLEDFRLPLGTASDATFSPFSDGGVFTVVAFSSFSDGGALTVVVVGTARFAFRGPSDFDLVSRGAAVEGVTSVGAEVVTVGGSVAGAVGVWDSGGAGCRASLALPPPRPRLLLVCVPRNGSPAPLVRVSCEPLVAFCPADTGVSGTLAHIDSARRDMEVYGNKKSREQEQVKIL